MTVEDLTAIQAIYQYLLDLEAYRAMLDDATAVILPSNLADTSINTVLQDGVKDIVDAAIVTAQFAFDEQSTVEDLAIAQSAYTKLTDLQAYLVSLQTDATAPVDVPTNIRGWYPDLPLELKNEPIATVTALVATAQTDFDNL